MAMTNLQRRWVEALESGKYEQGMGQLRNSNNRYCCLGVACDVNDPTLWDGVDMGWYKGEGDEELSDNLLNKLGLTSDDQCNLIDMNDNQRKTFPEIAAYLREFYNKNEPT